MSPMAKNFYYLFACLILHDVFKIHVWYGPNPKPIEMER